MKQSNATTIFILDEDELVAMALKHEIEKAFSNQITIVSTFSTAEKCELFLNQKPDIVIMNYELNTVCIGAGREITFIDKIKTANYRAHVIILTPHENAEIAVKSLHHGVHDYIVKNDFMFKKLRLSLIQCFTILELRRNMKKQVSLSVLAIVLVFLMFGVALSLSAYAPASFQLSQKIKNFKH